jgi:hypothetical protein
MKPWKIPNRIPVVNPTLAQALHRQRVTLKSLTYAIELECQTCHARYGIEVQASPLPRRWWQCGVCHTQEVRP